MPTVYDQYDDDMFADTRMSFGEHIEVLRTHLIRAFVGFFLCLISGFVLDGLGSATGTPIGLGKPMMDVIKKPVEDQVAEFYEVRRRNTQTRVDTATQQAELLPDVQQPLLETAPLKASLVLDGKVRQFLKVPDDVPMDARMPVTLEVPLANIYLLTKKGETVTGDRKYLTTLSVQEGFMVYFKVSLLCGFVLASPWVFYQLWSFVAAGLYPHERRYVHVYMPFSIGLFLAGVLLCQFYALPAAVKALLAFNQWLGLDPDLRLNEWLGFAIVMPVVFGVSFQTPIVMLFFERIGVFTADFYAQYWRISLFVMAILSAMLTPTPDAVSMAVLFVPMSGLYFLGIWLCRLYPTKPADDDEAAGEEVGI